MGPGTAGVSSAIVRSNLSPIRSATRIERRFACAITLMTRSAPTTSKA